MHNVEANARMFVRLILPSMLAQWQKFIPSAFVYYSIHVAAYWCPSVRILSAYKHGTTGSSSFAFQLLHPPWIECIMRMFLHVWITSPSMVSLSLMGRLQNVCSKCVGCLHTNPSMDEEAPPHHEQLQAWYLRAAYKNLFLMCSSSILRPDIAMATYKKFSYDVRLKAWNLWASG